MLDLAASIAKKLTENRGKLLLPRDLQPILTLAQFQKQSQI